MIAALTKRVVSTEQYGEAEIPELIEELADRNPALREKAREALVAIGKPGVPSLIRLLSHRKPHVRWEAAKALCGIVDPISAPALVNALDDRDGDVRWLAAEGLTGLGRDALQPLLSALLERSPPHGVYEGAYRVCHRLARKKRLGPILRPLLAALRRSQPEVSAPPAAYAALTRLRALDN